MAAKELTVTVTGFKARCLDLIRKLEHGDLKKITLTRRGNPVAETSPNPVPKKKSFADIYGCMRGTMQLAPDYDPFEQVIEEPAVNPEDWMLCAAYYSTKTAKNFEATWPPKKSPLMLRSSRPSAWNTYARSKLENSQA